MTEIVFAQHALRNEFKHIDINTHEILKNDFKGFDSEYILELSNNIYKILTTIVDSSKYDEKYRDIKNEIRRSLGSLQCSIRHSLKEGEGKMPNQHDATISLISFLSSISSTNIRKMLTEEKMLSRLPGGDYRDTKQVTSHSLKGKY